MRYSNIFLLISLVFFACKEKSNNSSTPIIEPFQKTNTLPAEIDESSGLLYHQQNLWTHNDSGTDACLYQVGISEERLIQTKCLNQTNNVDWEDITHDSNAIYIGDFGNNGGNRQNLVIYKFDQSNLSNTNSEITPQKIEFSYPDQSNFENEYYQHNFDCEAMISVGDQLFLFSKSHIKLNTKLYTLPKNEGTHTAILKDSFNVDGVITGAAINGLDEVLCLLGYNYITSDDTFAPFVWLLYDFDGVDFFGGKSKKIDLTINTQTEGIEFISGNQFLISEEVEDGGQAAALYTLDVSSYLE